MTVVCGTDLSDSAARAARVAAAIARRLGRGLSLVRVRAADEPDGGTTSLDAVAGALREEFGIEVTPMTEAGAPDEALVGLASKLQARLLVVGPIGARKQSRWTLGSVAERVAQTSSVPVLVVRDGSKLEAWARGDGALRVMVGVELTTESQAALAWARGLEVIGPSELLVAQIVWPADEHNRAGLAAPIPLDHLRPELEQSLRSRLEEWASIGQASGRAAFMVKPGWGRVDSHLMLLAEESNVDLLVVGTHQRAGIARLWQGSVSRSVLHGAPMSVACIPLPP